MQIVLTAIIPVLLIMGLGWFLRRRSLQSATFWAGLDHLVYFIFTPALFVSTISQTPLNSVPLGGLALSVACLLLWPPGSSCYYENHCEPPDQKWAAAYKARFGLIRMLA